MRKYNVFLSNTMSFTCIIMLALLSATATWADPVSKKSSAELKTLFEQGRSDIVLEALQSQGLKTAQDYYNAGLAATKLESYGIAYAYFLKANSLSPDNADIQYNLSLSKETLQKSGNLLVDHSWIRGVAIPKARALSTESLSLVLIFFSALLVGLGFFRHSRGFGFFGWIRHWSFYASFTPWSLSLLTLIFIVYLQSITLGVIVTKSGPTIAYSGPSAEYTELFKLPVGTQVELTGEKRGEWVQVRFSLGNVGWIMEKDVLGL